MKNVSRSIPFFTGTCCSKFGSISGFPTYWCTIQPSHDILSLIYGISNRNAILGVPWKSKWNPRVYPARVSTRAEANLLAAAVPKMVAASKRSVMSYHIAPGPCLSVWRIFTSNLQKCCDSREVAAH
jgi:hypothetical protein